MVTEARLAAYCTTPGATISNFADRLRPSSETTATVIGETIPGPTLWLHTCSMPESECRETPIHSSQSRFTLCVCR